MRYTIPFLLFFISFSLTGQAIKTDTDVQSGKKPTAMATSAANAAPKDTLCYEMRIYTASPKTL
jgi:hypothetical protein